MRVEGQCDSATAELLCARDGALDERTVSEVHTIEIADGHG
jgi:hypothetical protein